jgi:hypothetical protein
VLQEYIERTLTQDLRKYHGKGFPPLLAKWLAYQLLQGVQHMHASKVGTGRLMTETLLMQYRFHHAFTEHSPHGRPAQKNCLHSMDSCLMMHLLA